MVGMQCISISEVVENLK